MMESGNFVFVLLRNIQSFHKNENNCCAQKSLIIPHVFCLFCAAYTPSFLSFVPFSIWLFTLLYLPKRLPVLEAADLDTSVEVTCLCQVPPKIEDCPIFGNQKTLMD